MDLISTLSVVTAIYFISTLVGIAIFNSHQEKLIPLPIRIGFGYFLILFFLSAFWQFVSISYAWGMGLLCFTFYLYGRDGMDIFRVLISSIKIYYKNVINFYLLVIIGSLLFFAPLLISGNFGPFTEGGGDVSIYSDVSKLYTDKGLTAQGENGNLYSLNRNLSKIFKPESDGLTQPERELKKIKSFPLEIYSPPIAENASNNILATQFMGSFLYTPYGAYSFLSNDLNYPVYYGTQAFLYCLILAAAWFFFGYFGKYISLVSLLMLMGSHGLMSVFYNMYASQAFAIALGAMVLSALQYVPVNSWGGLRLYGVAIFSLGSVYAHFLALVFPLVLVSWRKNLNFLDITSFKYLITNSIRLNLTFLAKWLSKLFFFFIFFIISYISFNHSYKFIKTLVVGRLQGSTDIYFGESVSLLQWKSFSFLFGILSQQHYHPFVKEYFIINFAVILGIIIGLIAVIFGLYLLLRYFKELTTDPYTKKLASIYFVLFITIVMHAIITKSTLYTQAKGAQNAIVFFYFFLMIPLALISKIAHSNINIEKKYKLFFKIILVFILCLSIPRIFYVTRIALGEDRAKILESSYFSEAKKIIDSDPSPFVLFEPRISADLYVSIQPFFGVRMVPTRHLFLGIKKDWDSPRVDVLGSELIKADDLPHLWILKSEVRPKRHLFDFGSRYEWKGTRIANLHVPSIILFGNNYERNASDRSLSLEDTSHAKFSYLRNGSAMFYIPQGFNGDLTITLEPNNFQDYQKMFNELKEENYTLKIEGVSQSVKGDGKMISFKYHFSAESKGRFMTIIRYKGEFWLNAHFNGVYL
jgi:hypothetical protein